MWRFGVSLGTIAAVGLLPGPSAAVTGSVVVEPPVLPAFELGATSWLERDEEAAGGGARVDLDAVALATCPQILDVPVRLASCGGLEVGQLRAAGFGFAENQAQTEIVLHARFGVRIEFPIVTRLFLRGSLGVTIPLVRPRFYVDEAGADREVFQAAPVAGVAGVDLFVSF
jgi:hypothetical protein